MWVWAAGYFLLINLWAFGAFAFDKHRSRVGGRRLPERLLLRFAILGGTPGAVAAQQILRHKTRKEPFRSHLRLIGLSQATVLVTVIFGGPLLDLVLKSSGRR